MTEDERREYNRLRIARWRAAKKALLQSETNCVQGVTQSVTPRVTCNKSCNTADVTRHVTKPVTQPVTSQNLLILRENMSCNTRCNMLQDDVTSGYVTSSVTNDVTKSVTQDNRLKTEEKLTCNTFVNPSDDVEMTSCLTSHVTQDVTKPVTNHVTNQPKSLKSEEKSGCYKVCNMLQARERNEEKEEKERSKEKEDREEKKEFKKENPKEKSFVTGGVTKPVTDFLFPELENQGAQESKEKASPDEDFQKFWTVWPRKVAKAEAVKAFSSLWKAKKLPPVEELISAIRQQTSSLEWTRENFRFCPHPATWLRAQRWADEIGGVQSFAITKRIPERASVSAENQKPKPQILQKTVSASTYPENPKNSNFEAKPETVTTAPKIYDEHLALIERGRRRESALASVLRGQPITKESWIDIPEIQRAVFLRKNGLSVKDVKFK